MPFVRSSASRGGVLLPRARRGVVLGAALVALLLAGVAGAAVFQQLATGLDAPSPAQGHAQVIAQGVAPMPAGQVAWRVVEDTAEPVDLAEYQERALGFALAADDAIVVNNATSGTQDRLAPGEASFVPNGAYELRNSATDQSVSYDRIALVPAEAASDAGGDTLVFAGDAFDAPVLPDGHAGFDLDLVRDVLADGEETELPDTGFPTLIYVTEGRVEIDNVAQDVITLEAGEALSIQGNAEISADGEDATFVAALIGPAVPNPPRAFGTIAITTLLCAEGMTEETFDPDDCEAGPVAGGLALVLADGSTLPADASEAELGVYTWNGLAFGTYALAEIEPQEGYTPFVLLDADGTELDPDALTISRDAPDLRADLYFLPVPVETGSLSLATYVCPEGMTPENMVGDACDLAEPGTFDWQLGPADATSSEEIMTLADATGDGQPFYTWEDLPFGDDVLSPIQFPEGYALVAVPGTEPLPQQNFGVTIGPDQPDVELLAYFFLQPEEPVGAGSLTATFNLCAQGTSPNSFDPGQCQPTSGYDFGFDIVNNDTGASFSLDDAAISGPTAVWSDLPLGVYSLYPTPGPGYEQTAITGADGGDNVTSAYVIELSEAAPNREIEVYFFPPSGNFGTVAFVGQQCPTADAGDVECINGPAVALDAELLDAEGNPLPATINGVFVVWGEGEGLAFGTYTLVIDLGTVPDGYALDRMLGAYDDGDGDPSTWLVDVTEANPNAQVTALLVPTA